METSGPPSISSAMASSLTEYPSRLAYATSAALTAADALAVHVGVDDVAAERERSQDGGFRRGVVPLDVRRGVALGQAELLGLAQHVVVAVAVLLHAGEDVVGRAVDDPHDPDDLLPRQRLAQGPDHGDGACHRRLVEQVHPGGGGHLGQLGAGHGEQRLVRRHDRFAVAQGHLDQLVRRMEATDDLDHHVDVVAGHQRGGVVADEVGPDGGGARAVRVGDGDADELQADAGTGGDVVVADEQDLGQCAADVAASEQGDTHGRGRVRVWVGAAAGRCAGLVGGHLQTVQAARAPTCPFRLPGGHQPSRLARSSKVSRRTATRAVPSETRTTAGLGTLL